MFELNTNAGLQKKEKIWLNFSDGKLSYSEQTKRCHALLDWCVQNTIGEGALVLVAVKNELEQASLLCGLICIGRAPILLDPDATGTEIASVLQNVACAGIIADAELFAKWQLQNVSETYLQVTQKSKQSSLMGRLLAKKKTNEEFTTWPAIAENSADTALASLIENELAYLIFTSGTTSKPKGVQISRTALSAQLAVLHNHFSIDQKCNLLNVLPMHHVDGFVQGPLSAWVAGCTLHRPAAFSAATIQPLLECIYRERVTHFIAVPTMLSLIHRLGQEFAENFKSADFRFIVSCAGHLETDLWTNFEQQFAVRISNLYGLTETVTSALISGPDDASRMIGTLGLPINSEIKIVDENGNVIENGMPGELLIASNQLMMGYYQNEPATHEMIRNGWLHSGDLVQQLPSGHVQLVGRIKNLIISGGRNISPEEVIAVLNAHPNVHESIVLGSADADWGETVSALLVVRNTLTEAELVHLCREHLSEYKIPKRFYFVTELKKGPSGKIVMQAAREQLLQLQASIDSEQNTSIIDIETAVLQEAARCFRLSENSLSLNSSPENTAGWNSLEHMELVLALEARFTCKFSAREIMQIETLASAVNLCRNKVIEK